VFWLHAEITMESQAIQAANSGSGNRSPDQSQASSTSEKKRKSDWDGVQQSFSNSSPSSISSTATHVRNSYPAVIGSAPSASILTLSGTPTFSASAPIPLSVRKVTEASPLLSLRLSVDYRNNPGVLRDVSLSIQPGETSPSSVKAAPAKALLVNRVASFIVKVRVMRSIKEENRE